MTLLVLCIKKKKSFSRGINDLLPKCKKYVVTDRGHIQLNN